MATFYLLPPRECLEQAVAEFVGRLLPGVPCPATLCDDLLSELLAQYPDGEAFFVHREELPGADSPAEELADGFGAEPGDAVVEIGLAAGSRPAAVRRWELPGVVSAAGRAH